MHKPLKRREYLCMIMLIWPSEGRGQWFEIPSGAPIVSMA